MVSINGDSILNAVDQYGLFKESFKVRAKHHQGATKEDMVKPSKSI